MWVEVQRPFCKDVGVLGLGMLVRRFFGIRASGFYRFWGLGWSGCAVFGCIFLVQELHTLNPEPLHPKP